MIKEALPLAVVVAIGSTIWIYQTDQTSSSSSLNNLVASAVTQNHSGKQIPAATPGAGVEQVLAYMDASNTALAKQATFNLQQAQRFFPSRALKHGDSIYLTGKADRAVVAITAEDARQILLQGGGDYLGAGIHDDLNVTSAKRDQLGNAIYKYQQTYQDVPVFGRELVVQISPDSEISLVAGQYEPDINVSTKPQLSAHDALGVAFVNLDELPLNTPALLETPVLVVYTDEQTKPVLTWQARIEYETQQSGYHREQIFVDANTGKAVNRITMLQGAFSYGVYTMSNQCISTSSSSLPGTLMADNTDAHSTGTAANGTPTYWFYKNMFNRDSWDNNGKKLTSTIHIKFQGSSGTCTGDNAYFTGTQMVFGDGSTNLKNPGAAVDIFGHEFSHGFTSAESNLTYQNESGALNEAISDVMGTGVSAWKNSGGTSAGNPTTWNPTETDWTMGEDAALTLSWKRFMNDPAANGQSKDNYPDRTTSTSDSGGVHTNSGIMNLAFYMLSQGGTHPRQKSTVNVTGIGIEKALQVYYYANNNLFTSATNFQSARSLTASAAKTLYGCDAWESVHQSWDAVNVPGTRGTECTTDGGTSPTPTPTPTPTGNLALGTATVASSTYSTSYPVKNSTDGNTSSAWVSRTITNTGTTEYVQMNLGSSKTFSSVNLSWAGSDSAKRVAVWVWKNNAWTLVADVTGTTAISSVSFAAQTAQNVMVTMKNGNSYRWYAINEITIQ